MASAIKVKVTHGGNITIAGGTLPLRVVVPRLLKLLLPFSSRNALQ